MPMRFKGEACVKGGKALEAVKFIIQGLKPHFNFLKRRSQCYEVEFESSVAYVGVSKGRIWIRVEAEDLAIFHGTKMLIQSQICEHLVDMPEYLL